MSASAGKRKRSWPPIGLQQSAKKPQRQDFSWRVKALEKHCAELKEEILEMQDPLGPLQRLQERVEALEEWKDMIEKELFDLENKITDAHNKRQHTQG